MGRELPKNWIETEFRNLAGFVIGGDWGKDLDFEEDNYSNVYCIRGSEIKNWVKDFGSTAVLRRLKLSSIETRKLKENDILLEISGGGPDQPVGRTVLINAKVFDTLNDLPIVCTNFLRLVRPIKEVNSNYLNRFLQYFYFSGEIVKYQGGSNNLRNLKYKEFETIKIPLPPLAEQERIVAKLEALFAQHEAMKKALERIPQFLKDFRQQVLTQAVTGKLTEEWRTEKELKEWRNEKVKNIATKLGSGSTPRGGSETYLSEGIPLVRSMNVVFWGIKKEGLAFIDEKQAEALKNVEIHFNDLLLNITGASIGRVCLASKSVVGGRVNQHVFIIRTKKEIVYAEYINIYFSSSIIQDLINNENYGVTRQSITKSQIENIIVNIPPLQEQQEIISIVESFFAKADKIEAHYKILKEILNTLPQAILHKVFKGELIEQLPTDGDAKDLFNEIKKLKLKK